MLLAQRLQSVGVGRVAGLRPLADRKAKVFEQHLRELLRGVEVELLARDLLDLRLDRRQLRPELVLHLLEIRDVDGDPLGLHVREYTGERKFDLVEEIVDAQISHLGLEPRPEVEDRLSSPGGELRGVAVGDGGGLPRRATCAQQLLGADELHTQKVVRQVLEARIPRARPQEVGGQKRAERPVTLASAQGAERELCLLGIVAGDRTAGQRAGDSVHRLRSRDIKRVASGRDAEAADPAGAT